MNAIRLLLWIICITFSKILLAQIVYFEDFNSSSLGWTTINYDGNIRRVLSWPSYANGWISIDDPDSTGGTDKCFSSISDYMPIASSNDYLISPLITLSNRNVIKFDVLYDLLPLNYGEYEVLISTTTPDSSGFMANPPLARFFQERRRGWYRETVDLYDYAGQTVYLAFRNSGLRKARVSIDNVVVEVAPAGPDAVIVEYSNVSEYSMIPVHLASSTYTSNALIQNRGTDTLFNVLFTNNLVETNSVQATHTVSFPILAPGEKRTINHTFNFLPVKYDYCFFDYSLTHDSTDLTPNNNTYRSLETTFRDSILKRENDGLPRNFVEPKGSFGFPSGTSGEAGSIFALTVSDTITRIRAEFGSQSLPGDSVYYLLRSWNNGAPGLVLASTDTFVFSVTPGFFIWREKIMMAIPPTVLPADTFFISVVQTNNSIGLRYRYDHHTVGTNFVKEANGSWVNFGSVTEPYTFAIFPIFGKSKGIPVSLKGLAKSSDKNLVAYPNPFDMFITLKGEKITSVEVFNIKGQLQIQKTILETPNSITLNSSALKAGVYLIKVGTPSGTYIEKVIKQ